MKATVVRVMAVLACLMVQEGQAQGRATLKACMERASTDSALYPQKIDKDTTIMGVGCREEAGRVVYVYDNQLGVPKSKIPESMLGTQKIAVRNMLCTNPSLKPLLQLVDMEYAYYDSSRVFIGAITNRIEDCKGIGSVSLPLTQKSTKTEAPAKRQADLLRQAKAGNADAQYNLAVMYQLGDGGAKDPAKAVEWYEKAAAQGQALAQFQMGLRYLLGQGVPKDEAKGLGFIQQAAEKSVHEAQHLLGTLYANGEGGLPKNSIKAFSWLQKAAAQGNAAAQLTLGVKYATGEGVRRDLVRAYAWFSIAVAQGNDNAKANRDKAEGMLTAEQKSSGNQFASSWKNGVVF